MIQIASPRRDTRESASRRGFSVASALYAAGFHVGNCLRDFCLAMDVVLMNIEHDDEFERLAA